MAVLIADLLDGSTVLKLLLVVMALDSLSSHIDVRDETLP